MPLITAGSQLCNVDAYSATPTFNHNQPVTDRRGARRIAFGRNKKRPLKAAAADRRFSASGRSGSKTRQHPEENSCSVDATMSAYRAARGGACQTTPSATNKPSTNQPGNDSQNSESFTAPNLGTRSIRTSNGCDTPPNPTAAS